MAMSGIDCALWDLEAKRCGQTAAALAVRPSPLPQVQAVTYFARALGAARSGQPEAANAEIAKLDELHGKLKDPYWAGQVDIQRQIAAAWALYGAGLVATIAASLYVARVARRGLASATGE